MKMLWLKNGEKDCEELDDQIAGLLKKWFVEAKEMLEEDRVTIQRVLESHHKKLGRYYVEFDASRTEKKNDWSTSLDAFEIRVKKLLGIYEKKGAATDG